MGGSGVLDAAHAADEVERIAVEFSLLHVSVLHVNGDDLADYQAAALRGRREIQNLIKLAFETYRRGRYPRDLYYLRRGGGDVSDFELVDRGVVFAAGPFSALVSRCSNRSGSPCSVFTV